MQSEIEEIYAYTRIHSISIVCLCQNYHEMATKLSDQFFMNSAVTLTSKFQGRMINCQSLKDAWPDLHETKSSVNKFVDLFHI